MPNELIINSKPNETRVALVENGIVAELYIERKTGQELMGNIYRGRVVRVLPGMQAAFVDIGQDRTAFLYVSDIHRKTLDLESLMLQGNDDGTDVEEKSASDNNGENNVSELSFNIEDLLHEGQDIMVQVSKEPLGTKGARLTSYISLPGRHLVLLPTVNHIGISRRIEDLEERDRLRGMIKDIRIDNSGFIVRTVSEGADSDKLKSEMDFMLKLWK
ncbi:ribonuclease E/G, partial [Thermodesulfobacteriota bacterium]